MPFFSKVFKKDSSPKSLKTSPSYANGGPVQPPKPRWEDAWARKEVEPEEVQELIHACTQQMKARALQFHFVLLPFRPNSDPSAARTFVRNYFKGREDRSPQYTGEGLKTEMRLTEPMVLCSIIKWCWSRLPDGVVGWDAYELFNSGEKESNMARFSFEKLIPICVESMPRRKILLDFFDLLAAIAAHGKQNGLGGRKLSRMAGWWAFPHTDADNGFEGGYKSWSRAADATSHLFFAYLRSLSPENVKGMGGIATLPRSLQQLVSQTEYPPQAPTLLRTSTSKVIMMVDSVSPTPFALLRRARNFEYREDDYALQAFSEYEDPVQALSDECQRVLRAIATVNQTGSVGAAEETTPTQDGAWSRFEDMGFSDIGATRSEVDLTKSMRSAAPSRQLAGLRSRAMSGERNLARPATPSWADFLSSGFNHEFSETTTPVLMPPDKQLPSIGGRASSSQSHNRDSGSDMNLEPGELASISNLDLDETFWWVWMTSLAGEESPERKAAFGRCALIETSIHGARWLVFEEQVKGATPAPEEGAYFAEKKSRFGFSRRGRVTRRKSVDKRSPTVPTHGLSVRHDSDVASIKSQTTSAQKEKVQRAAAELASKQRQKEDAVTAAQRRARMSDSASAKTNSVMTLQPLIISEAGPALKWANRFDYEAKRADRETVRKQYLGDMNAGRGVPRSLPSPVPENAALDERAEDKAQSPISVQRDRATSPIEKTVTMEQTVFNTDTGRIEKLSMPRTPTQPLHQSNALTDKEEEAQQDRRDVEASPAPAYTAEPVVPNEQHPAFRNQSASLAAATPLVTKKEAPAPVPAAIPRKQPRAQPTQAQVPKSQTQPAQPARLQVQPRGDSLNKPQNKPHVNPLRQSPVEPEDHAQVQAPVAAPAQQQPRAEPAKLQPPANIAAAAAKHAMTSTPASPPAREPKKLQRTTSDEPNKADTEDAKGGRKGIKKLFGSKKAKSRAPPPRGSKEASSPTTKVEKPAPLLAMATQGRPEPVPEVEEKENHEPTLDVSSAPLPAFHDPRPVAPQGFENHSRVNSDELRDAEQHFSRFDQGPLEDQPMMMPRESAEISDAPSSPTHRLARRPVSGQNQSSMKQTIAANHDELDRTLAPVLNKPVEAAPVQLSPEISDHRVADNESEKSIEKPQQSFLESDRWARIRKNAEARRARVSEDQNSQHPSVSQRSGTEGEDGETSGEETIESRVARIKARVAELTGNIDSTGHIRTTNKEE